MRKEKLLHFLHRKIIFTKQYKIIKNIKKSPHYEDFLFISTFCLFFRYFH